MGSAVDREGNFRAEIIEYGMKEFDSGSVAVQIKVKLREMYDHENESWIPWEEYDQEAYGSVFVVKKDGTINETGMRTLIRNAGWNGDFDDIANRTWVPSLCQVNIKAETYQNQLQHKIAFVNAFDAIPGGMAMLDADKIKDLKTRFGSQVRAIVGTERQNSVTPAKGKPSAPPMSKKNAAAVNAQSPVAAGVGKLPPRGDAPPDDEVPF